MVQTKPKPSVEDFLHEAPANIAVVGVGGGGCNAIIRMMQEQVVPGVRYLCVNTDIKSLDRVTGAATAVQIGDKLTRGLGAGGRPEVGAEAAHNSQQEFRDLLGKPDLVFLTVGMGGGTGTGAAPVVADIAKSSGALVVGVVTTPFSFEGTRRIDTALSGIGSFKSKVDNLIVIHNDRLLHLLEEEVPMEEALRLADEAIMLGVHSIAELVNLPGEINVDMADVKTIMELPGQALMAIGQGSGPGAALDAAKQAVSNPLLDISIDGAKGILFNVSGGPSLTLGDVNDTGNFIAEKVDPSALIFFGMGNKEDLGDKVKITVISTGIPSKDGYLSNIETTSARVTDTESDVASIESLPPFLRRRA